MNAINARSLSFRTLTIALALAGASLAGTAHAEWY